MGITWNDIGIIFSYLVPSGGNTLISNWGAFLRKEDWDKVVQEYGPGPSLQKTLFPFPYRQRQFETILLQASRTILSCQSGNPAHAVQ